MSLKEDITRLRKEGKTYNEISAELKCAKSTVSHHCKKLGLGEGWLPRTYEHLVEKMQKLGRHNKEIAKQKIMLENYEDLSFERLRKRVIYEQEGKCNNCELETWLNEDIPLELEHKDGNNKNNDRNNLEMLCPNCHALTKTWRGRNKKRSNIGKVSDLELTSALLNHNWNMRQALLEVGLAAKGGNYKRCHRLKQDLEKLSIN